MAYKNISGVSSEIKEEIWGLHISYLAHLHCLLNVVKTTFLCSLFMRNNYKFDLAFSYQSFGKKKLPKYVDECWNLVSDVLGKTHLWYTL